MAIAVRINEGVQSTSGFDRDFEIEPWRVQGDEGELAYDIKVARNTIPVALGDPWKGDPVKNEGLLLREIRLLQWIGPDTAHFALIYAPPGRFGSLQNSATFGRTDSKDHALPVFTEIPLNEAKDNYRQEESIIMQRGQTTRTEYRILPASQKNRVIFASGEFTGSLYWFGGQPYMFQGASTRETSRGTISVAYWFHRKGWVPAISGKDISSAIDLPQLGPFQEYIIGRAGKKPFVNASGILHFGGGALPGL